MFFHVWEKGFFQSEIRKNAYRLKKEIDSEQRTIVGVNKFIEDTTAQKLLRVNDSIGVKQSRKIKKLKNNRDNLKTNYALTKLKDVANTTENLMPYIINSVKSYATTGEISDALREVFGEYKPKEVF